MLIKCPECSKANDLKLEAAVSCGHCRTQLTGHSYARVKRSIGTIVLAVGAGAFATKKAGDYLNYTNRYSIHDEYAIVEMCLHSSQRPLATYQYTAKRDDCICALDRVQNSRTVSDFNKDTSSYLAVFEAAAGICRTSRTSLSGSG